MVEYGLVLSIVVGSLALWIAVPVGSLWLTSHLSTNSTTVLLATLIVCPLAMLAFGLVLVALHRTYLRRSERDVVRNRSAWLGSLSGERVRRGPRPVLETSMTISAGVAFVLLLVFFLFFARNYSPGSPVP